MDKDKADYKKVIDLKQILEDYRNRKIDSAVAIDRILRILEQCG